MAKEILVKLFAEEINIMDFATWIAGKDINVPDLMNSSRAEFIVYFLEFVRSHADSVVLPKPKEIHPLNKKSTVTRVQPVTTIQTANSVQNEETDKNAFRKVIDKDHLTIIEPDNNIGTPTEKINASNKVIPPKHSPASNQPSTSFLTSTPSKSNEESAFKCWLAVSEEPINTNSNSLQHSKHGKDNNSTSLPGPSHSTSLPGPSQRIKNRPALSLGDFIPTSKPNKSKKNKKKNSSPRDSEDTSNSFLDVSNPEMFPGIGEQSKKQNKLMHRLAPGRNLTENISSPFKMDIDESLSNQSNFDNIWVTADVDQIISKEHLDKLVHIYEILSCKNLVPNITSDLYSFILILSSKQEKEHFQKISTKLKTGNSNEDLLKTIHNSTYFATNVLWKHHEFLYFILEKNSLRILGENKCLKQFCSELSHYLLDLYKYRCDNEIAQSEREDDSDAGDSTHGIVCWNSETDNLENFPSTTSFQAFKKQRDMFYEMYRWYPGTNEQNSTLRGTPFHSRIRSLLATAVSPANHAHLARLFVAHMSSECTSKEQECKLTKLQRRLTVATGDDNHLLPRFENKELFYKEFLSLAENDCFRTQVKDTLIAEIIGLEDTFYGEEQDCIDVSNKFLKLTKSLRLLSKFLSYVCMLPYCQVPVDFAMKTGANVNYGMKQIVNTVPKEKIYEQELFVRNNLQPPFDLKGMLGTAILNGRMSVTIPWLVQYLSMIDYTGVRTYYYADLIADLHKAYMTILTPESVPWMNTNNRFYLISILSWLFDLPHFPKSVLYSDLDNEIKFSIGNDDSIDSMDLIAQSKVVEFCPFLKRFQALLVSPSGQGAILNGSVKHLTPITIAHNLEYSKKIKTDELQRRLEQELLKGQPTATQRVVEMVVDRVTYLSVHEFRQHIATWIKISRKKAIQFVNELPIGRNEHEEDMLLAFKDLYADLLSRVVGVCNDTVEKSFKERVKPALDALITNGAKEQLAVVAFKLIKSRLYKWINEHLSTTDVLCKDIESYLKKLLKIGSNVAIPEDSDDKINLSFALLTMASESCEKDYISPSVVVFQLKAVMCSVMSKEDVWSEFDDCLRDAATVCREGNIMIRAPIKKSIFQLTVEMSILYLAYLPDEVNLQLLDKFDQVWNVCCPNRVHDNNAENEFDESNSHTAESYYDEPNRCESLATRTDEQEMYDSFKRLFCVRNIHLMCKSAPDPKKSWEKMVVYILYLLKKTYLTEDQLIQVGVAFLQVDWDPSYLLNISRCFASLRDRVSSSEQLVQYLDFLADTTAQLHHT